MERELIKQIGLKEYKIASAFTDMSGLSEGIQTAIKEMYVLGFADGYRKAQQEAKIIEGMKMDEKQANKGVCKDCYYAGSFTCEH